MVPSSHADCVPWASYRAGLTLAERLCRTADRIDPSRVSRSCHHPGRSAFASDSAIVRNVLGAGFELALMCDLRVCTHDAQFGVPAVRPGLPYRLEDIATILNVVGLAQAREMVLLGRRYGGEDALRLGLVNWLAGSAAGMATLVDAAAAELTSAAPLSLAAARVAFQELARRDGPPDVERAQRAADRCYASRDYAEGRAAQREKREPVFQGN